MSVKLSDEQLEAVKGMVEIAERFCDQIYHIMENHGLKDVEGCQLSMFVDPSLDLTTKYISFGNPGTDIGNVRISKGINEKYYTPFGRNSVEYEKMFADPRIAYKLNEKPLPQDGLWIGRD